jgi:GNAT superfamily N-acetyltransferase
MAAADLSTADAVRPDWAVGMTDLHVHASPSLLPRHGDDRATVAAERAQGVRSVVLKSHEGSTAERAALAGDDVYGGVVLNSPVGGANPDAVEVAARLGGRVVWMPTVSSRTHKAGAQSPELSVHRGFELRAVDVVDDGRLRPEWHDVLDAIAAHDLLLASGHLSAAETVVLFTEARRRGVGRLLVNHPKMAFLHWADRLAGELRALGAHLELGILPDLLGAPENSSLTLVDVYPAELLVFGGDLGHAEHPAPAQIMPSWLRDLERRAGARAAEKIMTVTTRELLLP